MTQHFTATQRALLVAGFAGCNERTARRFLTGSFVKGAVLRERLEAARSRVESLDMTQAPADRAPRTAERGAQ
jgi:hypothetical protein